MNADILIVLAILGGAVVLFVTEWVRFDGVALLVLVALALTGVLPPARAIEGFGNPAVVTIAAVLVLSGGLYRTGTANFLGRQVLRLAGRSATRVLALIMLTAGLLSAIMNNIAATALLLPVVLDIARRLRLAPSRLLIPLAWAALLGGMTTLIGTAPNILISGALGSAGFDPFRMFDYMPVGGAVFLAGILYMVVLGQRLLPDRRSDAERDAATGDIPGLAALGRNLFSLRLPDDSALAGRTLGRSRLGSALALNVICVRRGAKLLRAPAPDLALAAGDELIVEGSPESVEDLQSWGALTQAPDGSWESPFGPEAVIAELEIRDGSTLRGHTLAEADFANRFHAYVLAIGRGEMESGALLRTRLEDGDRLVVLAAADSVEQLKRAPEFSDVRVLDATTGARRSRPEGRLMRIRVPEESSLAGRTLAEMRLREAFDITVLAVQREGRVPQLARASSLLAAGDVLIAQGDPEELELLRALQSLQVSREAPPITALESDEAGFAEVTLSPRASMVGQTMQEIYFREKYGLSLLSIWRRGYGVHSNVALRTLPLQFGDALLVYGRRENIRLLARDPGFLVVTEEVHEVFRSGKAPLALAIMALVIGVAALNIMPIYITAPLGALLMVFTGCITDDEVYGLIQWRVLVLIGGMLALGAAMQESGAAELIARDVLGRAAELGPTALLASVFILSTLGAQFIPTAAVAVIMSSIALSTAAELGLSPQGLLMTVAISSSCAFMSPFGHAVNLLVMGVGGYKVTDYTRVGVPLVLILLAVVLLTVPVVWPLQP